MKVLNSPKAFCSLSLVLAFLLFALPTDKADEEEASPSGERGILRPPPARETPEPKELVEAPRRFKVTTPSADYQLKLDSLPRLHTPRFILRFDQSLPRRVPWRLPSTELSLGATAISSGGPQTRWATPSPLVKLTGLEPFLPQGLLGINTDFDLLKERLKLPKSSAKLRPRSPYCMPGHTSQNFVLTSVHDGLPLHPGVW